MRTLLIASIQNWLEFLVLKDCVPIIIDLTTIPLEVASHSMKIIHVVALQWFLLILKKYLNLRLHKTVNRYTNKFTNADSYVDTTVPHRVRDTITRVVG